MPIRHVTSSVLVIGWLALLAPRAGFCLGYPGQGPSGSTGTVPIVAVDELVMRRHAKVRVSPVFPRASVARRVEGVAVAALRVGTDGCVERVQVLQSPDDGIAMAITTAVKQWVFEPVQTLDSSRPAKVDTKLTFYYTVDHRGVGVILDPERPGLPNGSGTFARGESREIREIIGNEFETLTAKLPVRVVDIRTREQFSESHRAGAVNVPLDEVAARMQELRRADRIVIDCFPHMLDGCRAGGRLIVSLSRSTVWILVR